MAFDFENNININETINLNLIPQICQLLNKIITDRRNTDGLDIKLLATATANDNKDYILYNSVFPNIKNEFENWVPFFYKYKEQLHILQIIAYRPIWINEDLNSDKIPIFYTSAYNTYKLNPTDEKNIWNTGDLSIIDEYKIEAKENKLTPYKLKNLPFNITHIKFNFNMLYDILYVRTLMYMLNNNSSKFKTSYNFISSEHIPIINITNSLNEIVEFIEKIVSGTNNEKIFSQVTLSEFFENIKYNIIKHNVLNTNDLKKFDAIIDDVYNNNLYVICDSLINSGLIDKIKKSYNNESKCENV